MVQFLIRLQRVYGSAAPSGQSLLIIEAARSHSNTPHSAGLLWTRDQRDVETCTWQHTTLTRDRHPCPGRYSNQQS